MGKVVLRKQDILHPQLSYTIIGDAFDVFNELGAGHSEKCYEQALAEAFTNSGLKFERQLYFPLKYNNKTIGKRFLDFLVEDKIVVELKKGDRFSKTHIDQVLEYLKLNNYELAILVNFTANGVVFKRIVNFH